MRKIIITQIIILLTYILILPTYASFTDTSNKIPEIKSEAAILIDASNGQVLYQKDMDKKMYPASLTKIMTGMLAMENADMSEIITMSDNAVFSIDRDSSHIALDVGEQITLEQALYALSLASANDAANGIAELVGGTMEGFTDMMNTAAVEAGAENTNFVNAHGLPDENQYTTAHDLARITARALEIPGFIDIFGSRQYEIPPTNKQPETRILSSINKFINGTIPLEGLLFSKTGWTSQAHHTLVTAARRNGTTLIAVVLKSTDTNDKWTDTAALFDYGFEQFTPITISKDYILKAIPEDLITDKKLDPETLVTEDVSILLPKGNTLTDVKISCGAPMLDTKKEQVEIPVYLNLPKSNIPCSLTELPDTMLKAKPQKVAVEAAAIPSAEIDAPKKSIFSSKPLNIILIIVGIIIGLFLVLVLFNRFMAARRRRRRARNRRNNFKSY